MKAVARAHGAGRSGAHFAAVKPIVVLRFRSALASGRAVYSFRIFENFAFVIPAPRRGRHCGRVRIRDSPALCRRRRGIDDVLRHGITCSVTAQVFHDLQALAHAGAQMRGPGNQIALIQIIRFHPAHQEFLHVRLHDIYIVVHIAQAGRIGCPAGMPASASRPARRALR